MPNSMDPRAVAFLVKELNDPNADHVFRFEAHCNLARTGGEEGLKIVLGMRHRNSVLRPLAQRVIDGYLNADEFEMKTKLWVEKRNAAGTDWGLM